jgi:hypothetical protein
MEFKTGFFFKIDSKNFDVKAGYSPKSTLKEFEVKSVM